MGTSPASDVETYPSNAFMPRIAVRPASEILSRSHELNRCPLLLTQDREFQHMRSHISSLQQQVDSLFADLNSLRQHLEDSTPGQGAVYSTNESSETLAAQTLPTLSSSLHYRKAVLPFHGPTSSAYGFEVSNSTLQTMGITQESTIDESGVPSDSTATASPQGIASTHAHKDPLWLISREEAIRLCRVYEEEIGIIYPLFDIETIINHVNMLWSFLEAATRSGLVRRPGAEITDDDDTNLVKMILAVALILEGDGQSDLGQRLFDSLKAVITAKFWGPTDIKGLSLICVAVRYLGWAAFVDAVHLGPSAD